MSYIVDNLMCKCNINTYLCVCIHTYVFYMFIEVALMHDGCGFDFICTAGVGYMCTLMLICMYAGIYGMVWYNYEYISLYVYMTM